MNINPVLSSTIASPAAARDPAKVHDAAQQFEALLLGQMLRSERQSGSGWLGSGEDASAECVTDYAEQQFAAVLAQNGGLGIANLVAKGLAADTKPLPVARTSEKGRSTHPVDRR